MVQSLNIQHPLPTVTSQQQAAQTGDNETSTASTIFKVIAIVAIVFGVLIAMVTMKLAAAIILAGVGVGSSTLIIVYGNRIVNVFARSTGTATVVHGGGSTILVGQPPVQSFPPVTVSYTSTQQMNQRPGYTGQHTNVVLPPVNVQQGRPPAGQPQNVPVNRAFGGQGTNVVLPNAAPQSSPVYHQPAQQPRVGTPQPQQQPSVTVNRGFGGQGTNVVVPNVAPSFAPVYHQPVQQARVSTPQPQQQQQPQPTGNNRAFGGGVHDRRQ